MTGFLLTTDAGLEDLTADEVRELHPGALISQRPYGRPGQIRVVNASPLDLSRLGTVHHVIEIRGEAQARTLDDVRGTIEGLAFDELSGAASFRVSSVCDGEEQLERIAVQGAAGAVLVRRYGTKVDLQRFAVQVRADLYGRHLVAGLQLTRDSLGNRVRRGRVLRSSLRPTIAAAMLRLAGAHRGGGRLIDPMCGAGVIPVEAARLDPALEVSASDWDPQTVETARRTMRNHGLEIEVRLLDARHLGDAHHEPFDYIVTDPPYGLRQAKRTRLAPLYRSLLESFAGVLAPSGRIVLIAVKHRTFRAALDGTGLRVVAERVVDAGAIRPTIFTLEP